MESREAEKHPDSKAQNKQPAYLQLREGAFDLSCAHVARNAVGRVTENESKRKGFGDTPFISGTWGCWQ